MSRSLNKLAFLTQASMFGALGTDHIHMHPWGLERAKLALS